jgi:hypothetical protein
MKKTHVLVGVLVVALLTITAVIVVHTGQASQAQAPDVDDPGPWWDSSRPLPAGVPPESLSPPDRPDAADPLDRAIDTTYNASLRITGSAMRPRESDVEWREGSNGGCIYASSGDELTVWNTPVYLPQGSTVKYLRMYYDDQNATINCQAWFTVYDLYGEVVEEWETCSTGTGRTFATSSEFTHTVDYDLYSYAVNWRPWNLGDDMQVCGFRILYHTPPGAVALPLVLKDASP